MAKRILVDGMQDAACLGIDDHVRVGRVVSAPLRDVTPARLGGGGHERDHDGGRNDDRRERTEARAYRTCHFKTSPNARLPAFARVAAEEVGRVIQPACHIRSTASNGIDLRLRGG